MNDSTTKICTKCGIKYPATLEYFYADKRLKCGLQPQCKTCIIKRVNHHYDENNCRINEDRRLRYQNNLEQRRAQNRKRRNKNTEAMRRWRKKHPTYSSKYQRQRYKADPERHRVYARNRHARKRSAEGTHTDTDIQKQFQIQKGKCYYCDCKLKKKYHTDHVIPLARGGSNSSDNLVCTCPRCNMSKGSKTLREWIDAIPNTELAIRVAQRIIERESLLRNLFPTPR